MARYLDPKNDLVFKRVFGENPDLLQSFLNALLPLAEGQRIESLQYLSSENVPDNPLRKFSIVDVRCRDNYGRYFIVEMQMQWSNVFPNRMLLNASRTYSRQLLRGGAYGELQPVYGLGILNDVYDRETEEFYHCYQMLNSKNINEKIDGIEIIMVELPKFKPETWADRRMAVLWLRFLNEIKDNMRNSALPEELLSDDDIQKALAVCEEGAFTDEELEAYDHYWMDVSTEVTMLGNSFKEGKAEGIEEGRAAGLAQGAEERLRLEQHNHQLEDKYQQLEQQIAELKRMLGKQ